MKAIVGNGPLSAQDRKRIAGAGQIIRFNLTPNRLNGERTDTLYLSCSSKQIGAYLTEGRYREDRAFEDAKHIVLTYHPVIVRHHMPRPNLLARLAGRRYDWSALCEQVASEAGKMTDLRSANLYRTACAILDIDIGRKEFFPSSGFIAVLHEIDTPPDETGGVEIFGFGFQGWKRHRWDREKAYLSELSARGAVRLHPVP